MWKSRLSKTLDWFLSRRLVGEDKHHLFYTEFVAKGKPERRYVEFKDKDITHSSDRMPIEWWGWLHSRRDTTPTADEISFSQRKQQHLAEKVAILESEDEKQRLRQFAGGRPPGSGETEAETRARRKRKVLMELSKASTPGRGDDDAGERSCSGKEGGLVGYFEERGRRNEGGDSTGSGEDFQPGSWQPPQTTPRGK